MDKTQVAIIGGGPAGLAAALTLSRSMMTSIVFDAPTPSRNAASPFVAALPGLDKREPGDVRKAIRKDIASYPYATIEETGITTIEHETGGLTLVRDDGSSVTADRVLLAAGMVDILPEVPGLDDCWGRSVINCPFCHGIEWQNARWGIFAHRPEVLDAAEIYRNWTNKLTYFVAPELSLSPERRQQIRDLGVSIVDDLPNRLHSDGGDLQQAELADGKRVALDCLLVFPHQRQTGLVDALDLSLSDAGYVNVDEGSRTSQPRIYAAGDLTYAGHQNTPTALHMGNMAAASIVMDHCFGK
ncbi:NAD(P)/FAD-dependent oxidoreductase [Roseibium sp. MMSF_3412]|uniref:NAD(P)/FAD-dependent oxidoreductase n=1 Tax=Roseibium sp. MMSF_3412 TaxID=3046712 RepID=UPI00273F0C9B|nr:NAD(P)/FAD-dependent oxidoreductase [Roseibium sp. MMSF_3412]